MFKPMKWRSIFCYSVEKQQYLIKKNLFDFYNNEKDYLDFIETRDKSKFWEPIYKEIKKKVSHKKPCSILEFGAGRSGFAYYIELPKAGIVYDIQDITTRNIGQYENYAIRNFYDVELSSITTKYDIIFSTFVWEHIFNPVDILNHLLNLLKPEGKLIICSPRYDLPFYLSPSANHYSPLNKFKIALRLLLERIKTLIGVSPGFIIHLDPAIFHRKWKRDYDAIHWVSFYDLYKYLDRAKYSMKKIKIKSNSLMSFFYNHFMLLFVEIRNKETF